MKTKSLENMVVFEPENTYDAFILGQLFARTGKLFDINTKRTPDATTELRGLKCSPDGLVKNYLKALQDQMPF